MTAPATPGRQRLPLTRARVWAGALSLAATRAISVDFSSSGYLDVSVPPVAPDPYLIQAWVLGHDPGGFPHSETCGSKGVCPPRSLSQLAASFVDFLCQGIRRAPLVSFPSSPRSPVRLPGRFVHWIS